MVVYASLLQSTSEPHADKNNSLRGHRLPVGQIFTRRRRHTEGGGAEGPTPEGVHLRPVVYNDLDALAYIAHRLPSIHAVMTRILRGRPPVCPGLPNPAPRLGWQRAGMSGVPENAGTIGPTGRVEKGAGPKAKKLPKNEQPNTILKN